MLRPLPRWVLLVAHPRTAPGTALCLQGLAPATRLLLDTADTAAHQASPAESLQVAVDETVASTASSQAPILHL